MLTRYGAVSSALLAATLPPWVLLHRRYGDPAAARFAAGMAGTVALQQALVGVALASRERSHDLTPVDLMTLSRGAAAAVLTGIILAPLRDRRGPAGWLGWLSILYGAILCDWLDGPIARHTRTSEIGAVLDREADSWLTLCTAGAAVAWGGLPRSVLGPPLLRYLLLVEGMRRRPYNALHGDEAPWVRHLGIVQMLLFIAGLAPFGGRATRFIVQMVAPVQAPLQIAGLLLLHRRRA